MERKHPHYNNGAYRWNAKLKTWQYLAQGRAHGIFKDVQITPSVVAKAEKRKLLYMHSHARRRFLAERECKP